MPRRPSGGFQEVLWHEAVSCLPRPCCQAVQVRLAPMMISPVVKQSPHSASILQPRQLNPLQHEKQVSHILSVANLRWPVSQAQGTILRKASASLVFPFPTRVSG